MSNPHVGPGGRGGWRFQLTGALPFATPNSARKGSLGLNPQRISGTARKPESVPERILVPPRLASFVSLEPRQACLSQLTTLSAPPPPGGYSHIKGRDARREISYEPPKDANLGMA